MTNLKKFLLILFTTGLILRIIPVILTWHIGIGLDDMFQYDMLARSIVTGNGYRWYSQPDLALLTPYIQFDLTNYDPRGVLTTYRPPLYPTFLALVYFFSGIGANRFIAARLMQTVLGALLAPLTVLISGEAFPGNERAARFAGWIIACYPMLLLYPLGLATENLFFLCLTGAILLTLLTARKNDRWLAIAAGIVFGLAMLTRSVIAFAIPIAFLWLWFDRRQRRNAILLGLAAALIITPWVIRNSLIQGRLANVENSLGYNLYNSYHPDGDGGFQVGISFDLMHYLDDRERDEAGMAAFRQFVSDDPGRIPQLMMNRLGFFFGLERRELTYFYSNNFFGHLKLPLMILIAIFFWAPFVVISLSACFLFMTKWDSGMRLLLLTSMAYLLPHIAIISEARFHLSLIPVFSILAAQVWTTRKDVFEFFRITGKKWLIALSLLLCILLVFNWFHELALDWPGLVALFGPNGNTLYLVY